MIVDGLKMHMSDSDVVDKSSFALFSLALDVPSLSLTLFNLAIIPLLISCIQKHKNDASTLSNPVALLTVLCRNHIPVRSSLNKLNAIPLLSSLLTLHPKADPNFIKCINDILTLLRGTNTSKSSSSSSSMSSESTSSLLDSKFTRLNIQPSSSTSSSSSSSYTTSVPHIKCGDSLCCSTKDLKECSRCKQVSYCSKECQSHDWKDHKKVCKKVEECTSPPVKCADSLCCSTKDLKECSRCKQVSYCSRECQSHDWKTHKPNCVDLTNSKK